MLLVLSVSGSDPLKTMPRHLRSLAPREKRKLNTQSYKLNLIRKILYAEEQLRKKIEYLSKLEAEFKELADRLAELDSTFQKTDKEMTGYKRELDDL